jgi:hypothetical protein
MNNQPRALRLLCPQGCGTTLTISMPTLIEVNEMSGDTSLKNLDTLVGRNVVGAVLVHCIYTCTAISEVYPMTHVVGNPLRGIEEHDDVTLVDADTNPDRLRRTSGGHGRRMN